MAEGNGRPRREGVNYAYVSPPDPIRGMVLSLRRKQFILEFKSMDRKNIGSAAWQTRLYKYLNKLEATITIDDVSRWIKSHSWINDPEGSVAIPVKTVSETKASKNEPAKPGDKKSSKLTATVKNSSKKVDVAQASSSKSSAPPPEPNAVAKGSKGKQKLTARMETGGGINRRILAAKMEPNGAGAAVAKGVAKQPKSAISAVPPPAPLNTRKGPVKRNLAQKGKTQMDVAHSDSEDSVDEEFEAEESTGFDESEDLSENESEDEEEPMDEHESMNQQPKASAKASSVPPPKPKAVAVPTSKVGGHAEKGIKGKPPRSVRAESEKPANATSGKIPAAKGEAEKPKPAVSTRSKGASVPPPEPKVKLPTPTKMTTITSPPAPLNTKKGPAQRNLADKEALQMDVAHSDSEESEGEESDEESTVLEKSESLSENDCMDEYESMNHDEPKASTSKTKASSVPPPKPKAVAAPTSKAGGHAEKGTKGKPPRSVRAESEKPANATSGKIPAAKGEAEKPKPAVSTRSKGASVPPPEPKVKLPTPTKMTTITSPPALLNTKKGPTQRNLADKETLQMDVTHSDSEDSEEEGDESELSGDEDVSMEVTEDSDQGETTVEISQLENGEPEEESNSESEEDTASESEDDDDVTPEVSFVEEAVVAENFSLLDITS